MKAGLSAAFSVFIIVLTTVSVITLLYFFVTSTSSPTVLEWLTVIGIVIVIYVVGTAVSLVGLHAIEKLFERDKNRAIRRQGK
jgi:ABC-type arginine transport system permease subunit